MQKNLKKIYLRSIKHSVNFDTGMTMLRIRVVEGGPSSAQAVAEERMRSKAPLQPPEKAERGPA